MKQILLTLLLMVMITNCANAINDKKYIGEFLDTNIQEPSLKIIKNTDNSYSTEILIYRLTLLADKNAKLTKKGLKFSSTDASGNPIKGIITVKRKTATVTFTDSSWEYIKSNTRFVYKR